MGGVLSNARITTVTPWRFLRTSTKLLAKGKAASHIQ